MKQYFSLLFFVVFFSCMSESETKNNGDLLSINVNYDLDKIPPFEESGYDFSYEIVFFSTDTSNAGSYIGDYNKILVYKDRYYFYDFRSAPKIFDADGNFIKSLVVGRGHGEVGKTINDIFLDKERDLLGVSNMGQPISYYDLSGNFIEQYPIKLSCSDVIKHGDYYFYYDGMMGSGDHMVTVVDHNTKGVCGNYIDKWYKDSGTGFMSSNVFSVSDDGDMYFNVSYTNKIYKVNKGDSIASEFAIIDNLYVARECDMYYPSNDREKASDNKKLVRMRHISVSMDENLISFTVEKDEDIDCRVMYDRVQNKVFKYPVTSLYHIYFDGEYDYFIFKPSVYDNIKSKFVATERSLEKQLLELVAKNGVDTNPYVVKVKIIKK